MRTLICAVAGLTREVLLQFVPLPLFPARVLPDSVPAELVEREFPELADMAVEFAAEFELLADND